MKRRKRERSDNSHKEADDDGDMESSLTPSEPANPFVSCTFRDLGLCDILSDHMQERMRFSAPTRIQQAAIPSILSERDILVKAETGTGKTVVYLAPIIHKLQANMKTISRSDGTFALVLVPTRELCLQVYEVMKQLVHRFQWLVPGYIMGGENRTKEKARLRKGITILVATPGRLLDHLQNTSCFDRKNLQWIVFDEADRLLDLGFGKDIKSILSILDSQPVGNPKTHARNKGRHRQHLLLSATLGDGVMELASLSLRNPVTVGLTELPKKSANLSSESGTLSLDSNGGNRDNDVQAPLEYNVPVQLVQRYMTVPGNLRLVTLLMILRMYLVVTNRHRHKVVVFLSTCDSVDFHYALLNDFFWTFSPNGERETERGFLACKSLRLHGNMSQKERTSTFFEFNKEDSALLLCTDVAARGLDIPKVTHILQYDPPGDPNEYVHRVGRTARLGKKGEALLFLQPCEREYLTELQKHGVAIDDLSFSNFWRTTFARLKVGSFESDNLSVEMHPNVLLLQKALEAFVVRQASMKELAADAFRSYVRAYTTYKGDLKTIFQVRKLHLGHVAKSFGLRDSPSLLAKSLNKKRSREVKANATKKRKQKRMKPASMLE